MILPQTCTTEGAGLSPSILQKSYCIFYFLFLFYFIYLFYLFIFIIFGIFQIVWNFVRNLYFGHQFAYIVLVQSSLEAYWAPSGPSCITNFGRLRDTNSRRQFLFGISTDVVTFQFTPKRTTTLNHLALFQKKKQSSDALHNGSF